MNVAIMSAWASKINWTQAFSVIATMAAFFGFNIPKELLPAILVAINAVTAVITIILRTWFTTKVTTASVK